jgi:disulfide oxidoreductase YuzD
MFTARNLAASCPDCNTAKGAKETLKTPNRKTYPKGSSDFRIVHPHFDNFADHIYRVGHIYVPKSKKGNHTIVVCDLLRFAEKYIDWENSAIDTRFEAEVNAAFDDDRVMGLAAVADIVAKLPKGPAP